MAEEVDAPSTDGATATPAFQMLEELWQTGKLTEMQFEKYKAQYTKLHETVLTLYGNEKRLLKRGRQLKADLLVEKQNLEASAASEGDNSGSLESLRDDLAAAQDQTQMEEEKEAMLQLQIAEYKRQKLELEEDIEEAKRRKAAEFEPHVRQLEADIAELCDTIAEQKDSITKMDAEKKENIIHIQELQTQIVGLETAKLECTAERRKVAGEPDKVLKQAEVVANAKKTLQRELDKLDERSHEIEVTQTGQVQTRKALETQSAELDLKLDQQLSVTEEKQRACDEASKKVKIAQAEHEDHLAEQVKLELEMKGKMADVKREQRKRKQICRKIIIRFHVRHGEKTHAISIISFICIPEVFL